VVCVWKVVTGGTAAVTEDVRLGGMVQKEKRGN